MGARPPNQARPRAVAAAPPSHPGHTRWDDSPPARLSRLTPDVLRPITARVPLGLYRR